MGYTTWRSHVTYQWAAEESCHISIRHGEVVSQINEPWRMSYATWRSHVSYQCAVEKSCHMSIRHGRVVSRMGWLRWVGSLKLQVSFAKEPHEKDYILQKRPTILRSLLFVATPYQWTMTNELYHMEESCHVSVSHVETPSHDDQGITCSTYNFLARMSRVTYQYAMSQINCILSHISEPCHISASHVTYKWVLWKHWVITIKASIAQNLGMGWLRLVGSIKS